MKPMFQPQKSSTDVGAPQQRPRAVAPPVDVFETASAVVVLADVPGVDQDGIDITVDRGVLTLRAKTKQMPPQGFNSVYQEYVPADFERQFTLSDAIDSTNVAASVTNGVLRIELSKAKAAVARKIAVTAG
jgi:HSP20 family protein